jgi:hypothetical protein
MVTNSKVALGDWYSAMSTIAKLDTSVTTRRVRAYELLSMFYVVSY